MLSLTASHFIIRNFLIKSSLKHISSLKINWDIHFNARNCYPQVNSPYSPSLTHTHTHSWSLLSREWHIKRSHFTWFIFLWFMLPQTGSFSHHRHHINEEKKWMGEGGRESLHACNIDMSSVWLAWKWRAKLINYVEV